MSYFSVTAVEPHEAEQVYALVRTFAPEAPPELWATFAASRIKRGTLLALRGPDGGIFGLATYRIEDRAGAGRALLVENFVALELSRSAPGRKLLAATLGQLAAQWECSEIRQLFACGGLPGWDDGVLRNHLMLGDSSQGTRFNKGADCCCGNVHALTAAEMYPAR